MGKLKVVSEALDPKLTLGIVFERQDATFAAGEDVAGTIQCHAEHAFECEGIAVALEGKEQVKGIEHRPFTWEKILLEQKIDLDRGQSDAFSSGTHSITFSIHLDPTLAPTYTFESPCIGGLSEIKLIRFYSVSVVFSLRNSTKVETIKGIFVQRNPEVVWSGSLPSASLEDSVLQVVSSPLSSCLCWRRGETSLLATIHNRTVDIASGVVHVRVFVVNRSGMNVNAARLCLLSDTALHAENDIDDDDEEVSGPVHVLELLSATDYQSVTVVPGDSAHFNLELDVKRVAVSLLFDQETILEPSIRTNYLEIGYFVRVEVCHAHGGSTLSVDLPLVLVPQPSDILPPLETHPLTPIRGRDSLASTEHADEDLESKSKPLNSHVSSVELRPVQAVTDQHADPTPPNNAAGDERAAPATVLTVPPSASISERDIHLTLHQDA